MKKMACVLTMLLVLLCGTAVAEISIGGGLPTLADENGVISLTDDVVLTGKVQFEEGKSYIIKGNGHKLSRGDSYTGTLFDVPKNSSLTIENLTIDGKNSWKLDADKWNLMKEKTKNNETSGQTEISAAIVSDGVVAKETIFMMNASKVTLKNTTIQNCFTDSWGYIFVGKDDAELTLENGSHIMHCASTLMDNRGSLANMKGGKVLLNDGVKIEDMFAAGNGGLFILWGDCELTINDVLIQNVKTVNSNGQMVRSQESSTIIMNAGTIQNFEGLLGAQNGRNSIICANGSQLIMNGGTIRNNAIGNNGAIEASGGQMTLKKGTISGNYTNRTGATSYSVYAGKNVTVEREMSLDQPIGFVNSWGAVVKDLDDNHKQWLKTAACRIGNVYYARVEEAVSQTNDGDTVEMVKDSQLIWRNYCGIANKSITLNLNGKTLTQTETGYPIAAIDNGILYVMDSTCYSDGVGDASSTEAGYEGGGWLIAPENVATLKNGGQLILKKTEKPITPEITPDIDVMTPEIPQTGDSTPLMFMVLAMCLSMLGLLLVKKNLEEQ